MIIIVVIRRMKMKKNGFTLVELLATIIILGMILTMAYQAYHSYIRKSSEDSFKIAENTLRTNAKDAYADCLAGSTNEFCKNHQSFGYQNETIYFHELIQYGYAEPIKDPDDSNSQCDESKSYVIAQVQNSTSMNKIVNYTVCLVCGNQKSSTCTD